MKNFKTITAIVIMSVFCGCTAALQTQGTNINGLFEIVDSAIIPGGEKITVGMTEAVIGSALGLPWKDAVISASTAIVETRYWIYFIETTDRPDHYFVTGLFVRDGKLIGIEKPHYEPKIECGYYYEKEGGGGYVGLK